MGKERYASEEAVHNLRGVDVSLGQGKSVRESCKMQARGVPEYIRPDNGPEIAARKLRTWLANVGARTLYVTLCSPWENGCRERFNGRLRHAACRSAPPPPLRDQPAPIRLFPTRPRAMLSPSPGRQVPGQ